MSFSRVVVRCFSSSSVSQQMIKPPIQVFGLEGRYATALYSAAIKQKSLNTVEKDLDKFQNLVKTDAQLAEFVRDPSIKRKNKSDTLMAIAQKISMNPATANMLALLAENGRLNRINQVIFAFKLIMTASRGEINCEVITAKPLDADMKSKLEKALKAFMKKGETLQLQTKVDPAIMGGMIVSIGDRYVDMSIASKVKKYSDIISAPV